MWFFPRWLFVICPIFGSKWRSPIYTKRCYPVLTGVDRCGVSASFPTGRQDECVGRIRLSGIREGFCRRNQNTCPRRIQHIRLDIRGYVAMGGLFHQTCTFTLFLALRSNSILEMSMIFRPPAITLSSPFWPKVKTTDVITEKSGVSFIFAGKPRLI